MDHITSQLQMHALDFERFKEQMSEIRKNTPELIAADAACAVFHILSKADVPERLKRELFLEIEDILCKKLYKGI